ncbi:S41 family peptidase [Nonomuraea roseoviolacea]|uniref:Carboxyl-terminal processing protease n=1 Tax=Nonomuraea roseoviolacea subsp. carminata TaxID=160689 RepID=A0ABT1KFM2_9ACTN|nr:S41 family peptidase [Nonomuraea roseoviolacea]MCP2352161.1 carboxyl-terminal processing protease [Nonomuraea roseoviolacea subsp. carminata]
MTSLDFGAESVPVILPASDPSLGGASVLFRASKAEFEAVFGASLDVRGPGPVEGPRWELVIDPAHDGPAVLDWSPQDRVLTSRAADASGLMRTFQLVHTMARTRSTREVDAACPHLQDAVDRTIAEVGAAFPGLELRGLDWPEICDEHAKGVVEASDPLAAAQRWTARLQDAHTKIEPAARPAPPPYVVSVRDGAAWFVRVPEGTPAFEAGVRPGQRIVGLDGASGPELARLIEDCRSRTAAPRHMLGLLTGRRLLSMRKETDIRVAGAEWTEDGRCDPVELIEWRRLAADTGYVRLKIWQGQVAEGFDAALAELKGCDRLVLDLRGNVGGDLMLATGARDRFLREATHLGCIAYTDGHGGLGPRVAFRGEPSSERRWPGRLVVLTDPLTYSSSEDFLLGLQGLEHVTVIGRPSGGGSGRARSLRLLPDWVLTVSTALTYDKTGRCVENSGVPVDVTVRSDGPGHGPDDPAIQAALKS